LKREEDNEVWERETMRRVKRSGVELKIVIYAGSRKNVG
jgi:hypothetical protein